MTLEEAIKRYTSNAFYEKSDGNLQGYLEFNQLAEWLKDYKRLLEKEPKTENWIPVSERLPENVDDVLVTDDEDIFIGWYDYQWFSNDTRFYPASHPIKEWMPLPKQYKAEKE